MTTEKGSFLREKLVFSKPTQISLLLLMARGGKCNKTAIQWPNRHVCGECNGDYRASNCNVCHSWIRLEWTIQLLFFLCCTPFTALQGFLSYKTFWILGKWASVDFDSQILLEGIANGFRIVPGITDNQPAECANYPSALEPKVKALLDGHFETELMKGKLLYVKKKPLRVNAMGAVPKKGCNTPRPITDCSRSCSCSLNSYYRYEHFSLNPSMTSFGLASLVVFILWWTCSPRTGWFQCIPIIGPFKELNCPLETQPLNIMWIGSFVLVHKCAWNFSKNFRCNSAFDA